MEELYEQFLRDPQSVSQDWRGYFEGLSNGKDPGARQALGPSFKPFSMFNPPGGNGRRAILKPTRTEAPSPLTPIPRGGEGNREAGQRPAVQTAGTEAGATTRVSVARALQERVDQLIRNYRVRGHIIARLDPLGQPPPEPPELNPKHYGFTEEDMDTPFSTAMITGAGGMTLRKIVQRLRNTYCRSIGAQFMHIDDLAVREWLQERMEASENRAELTRSQQLRILTRLTDAVIFEEFIQRKFIGAKSFSLEGAESLIPLLEMAIEKAGQQGVREIVFGMAHRGRLNVLANIMGKSVRQIFREFDDKLVGPASVPAGRDAGPTGKGDVKYHLGHSGEWTCANGARMHLSLCFNPSHLEFVNPVAEGRMRAKQDRIGDNAGTQGLCILIHGDAAFAGEGVIQETLNMSELRGYRTGGTLHIIVNNQLGFTTLPAEGRSSVYCTDVAKMLQTPIFHVNGEDPEAVAQVVRLGMEFRATFQRDVFIDMYCYRRRGHNEGDEPAFTQPLLYQAIENRKPVREAYLERLLKLGEITQEEADQIGTKRREQLQTDLDKARSRGPSQRLPAGEGLWWGFVGGSESAATDVETAVSRENLSELLEALTRVPDGFTVHPKLARLLEQRRQMASGAKPLDWSAAEALAFASLATSGVRIRLSGQDSARGTFSHRHAMLFDVKTGAGYMPLQHLQPGQAKVEIYNSPLSETGVLGFEYGYSLDYPDALVLWEAQFGDFWNAAQVIVDQFLASAEEKWSRLSGLVLLLPHGLEGMGPEHSSARMERLLAMFAADNIQVVNATTPAQYFHCLRRQALRKWRKPLAIMTPKSLLRHPEAVSTLDELASGTFQRVIPDAFPKGKGEKKDSAPKRILLCSGKIYYELKTRRGERERRHYPILRIEQLAPLPQEALKNALAPYPDGTPVFWVQEEPENMGAWRYLRAKCGQELFGTFPFNGIYRPEAASPATGSAAAHQAQQKLLLQTAIP
jgi:2-oxoglutarate dehydrogenase E1 component